MVRNDLQVRILCATPYFWGISVKVITYDCLSYNKGSIPLSLANIYGNNSMVRVTSLYLVGCGFKSYFPYHVPIVQWIEHRSSKPTIQVRLLVGTPLWPHRQTGYSHQPFTLKFEGSSPSEATIWLGSSNGRARD